MAYAASMMANTVHGNDRVTQLRINMDGATHTIEAGLGYVYAAVVTPISMASFSSHSIRVNYTASGVSALGYVGASGLATGDYFFLTCYGR